MKILSSTARRGLLCRGGRSPGLRVWLAVRLPITLLQWRIELAARLPLRGQRQNCWYRPTHWLPVSPRLRRKRRAPRPIRQTDYKQASSWIATPSWVPGWRQAQMPQSANRQYTNRQSTNRQSVHKVVVSAPLFVYKQGKAGRLSSTMQLCCPGECWSCRCCHLS